MTGYVNVELAKFKVQVELHACEYAQSVGWGAVHLRHIGSSAHRMESVLLKRSTYIFFATNKVVARTKHCKTNLS